MYLKLALLSLLRRPLRQGIVFLLIALTVALPVFLLQMTGGLYYGINRATEPFPIVVGAKGSAYQLVLHTVFLKDRPLENISYTVADSLRSSQKADGVYPLAFGDNYRGFPIVGVEKEIFSYRVKKSDTPWLSVEEGRIFSGEREVVLGYQVAELTGLRVGDTFASIHGMNEKGASHGGKNRVVGILAPIKGPYDSAIFTDIQDVWKVHHLPSWQEKGDVTAILVHPVGYKEALQLLSKYQRNKEVQMVFPAQSVISLYYMVGQSKTFWEFVMAGLLVIVLFLTLLVMYWNGRSRVREFALLKALGAEEGHLMTMIVIEEAILLLISAMVGWGVAWGTVLLTAQAISGETAIIMDTAPLWEGLVLIPGVTFLGTGAALFPAYLIKKKDLSSYL